MKRCFRYFILVIFLFSCGTLLAGCNKQTEKARYDIEYVYTDDTFKKIIEGEIIPVEIIVGFGGEGGYEQFSTNDPAMIAEYINAFREVKIEKETDDKDEMIFVADGIVDFTFVMDDETKILIGTDMVHYVNDYDRGIQFHLSNTDLINELNRRLVEESTN